MSYIEEFVEEAEREIRNLSDAILNYEDEKSQEALQEAFRSSHTLKGNAAAMGFDGIETVSHAIEDVFDKVRGGEIDLTEDQIDILFEGIDVLRKGIKDASRDGEEDIDVERVEKSIRSILDEKKEKNIETNYEKTSTDRDSKKTSIEIDVKKGEMDGVNSILVLEKLKELYSEIQTGPNEEKIEEGVDSFIVYIDSPDIEKIEEISKVKSASKKENKKYKKTKKGRKEEKQDIEKDITDSVNGEGSSIDTDRNGHSVDEIESVRVDVEQLDNLLRRAEELVTSRIKLRRSIQKENFDEANEELKELERISSSLQDSIMEIRLVPLDEIVRNFPRMVRDIARDQDKKIDFSMKGTDVSLDRNILNDLGDPLVHLLRNAIDHGIEDPEVRRKKGKPEEGSVELIARRKHDTVVVEVSDDGRGIDSDDIIDKAVEEDMITRKEAEEYEDDEIYDLMFQSGFSTNEEVTEVSGRGVGMDVVRDFIEGIGSVDVESKIGEGTTIQLTLPVTISILDVLIVQVDNMRYALPLSDIDKIERNIEVDKTEGVEVVKNNDGLVSLIRLNDIVDVSNGNSSNVSSSSFSSDSNLVFIEIDDSVREVVLSCSDIIGIEEVVIKPLEGVLNNIKGINGAAVLEEGEIVPVLDIPRL